MNLIKVFDSKLKKEFWEDNNHNKWSAKRFCRDTAEYYSGTLDDCYNCIDCKLCGNCEDCIGCLCCCRCKNCRDCYYSEGLIGCVDCSMSEYCNNSNYCEHSRNCNSACSDSFRDMVIVEISKKEFMEWECMTLPIPNPCIEYKYSTSILKHIERLKDGIYCDLMKLRDSNGLFYYIYYWMDNEEIIGESDLFESIDDIIGEFDDGFGREFRTVLI